jgi:hypothetical protein
MPSHPALWSEVDLFRTLLKVLHDRERCSEPRGATPEALLARYPRLEDRNFERKLPSMNNKLGSFGNIRRYLYLERIDREGIVPVLNARWDFSDTQARIGLRLMLFLVEDWREFRIGFRFESAEVDGDMHSYPHVQLIRRLEGPDNAIEPASATAAQSEDTRGMPWLPETQPALPLPPVSTSAGLLLALVLSLYGPRILREIRQTLHTGGQSAALFEKECEFIMRNASLNRE